MCPKRDIDTTEKRSSDNESYHSKSRAEQLPGKQNNRSQRIQALILFKQ